MGSRSKTLSKTGNTLIKTLIRQFLGSRILTGFAEQERFSPQLLYDRLRRHMVSLLVPAVILFIGASDTLRFGEAGGDSIFSGYEQTEGGPEVEEIITYTEDDQSFFDAQLFSASFLSPVLFATSAAPPEKEGESTEDLGFVNIQSDTLIASSSPLTTLTSASERNEIVVYVVKQGDTPSTIAASFGISTSTLLWANKLKATDYIKPGDELAILPVSGVIHKVAKGETLGGIVKKYKGNMEETIAFNGLPADGTVVIGDTVVVPDGEMPAPPAPVKKVYASTSGAARFVSAPVSAGYFIYPTTGRNWGRRHANNGVDVANSCGTPVYAAADGKVTVSDGAGWNGGYGKFIKLAHANGTATLYAHHSQNLVSMGESVRQGQLIAYMGTTGRSTGCHLHFEVHGAKNPLIR